MYLPSNTPFLAGRVTDVAREGACSDQRIDAMRRTSATGRAALFNTLINPNSVASTMSNGTALDVARMQQQTESSRATGILGTTIDLGDESIADIVQNAPEVVSLHRGANCGMPGKAAQYQVPVNPVPLMPQAAPQIINTPQGPLHVQQTITPQLENLCMALRNGAVDRSQFDTAEYNALSWRCTQQGYQGACPPPPDTQAYLEQGRRAGTLPHIAVPQTVIDAIPQAPDYSGVNCAESYKIAGLTGYAPPWSDAWVMQTADSAQANDMGVAGWISDHPWLSLGLAAAGAFALSRRSK